MQERRREPRECVSEMGKVIDNSVNTIFDCRIRDLTAHGARLWIERAWAVPNDFDFIDTTRADIKRPARVVWRKLTEFGICFEDPASV